MIEHLPGLEPKDRVMLSRLRFVYTLKGGLGKALDETLIEDEELFICMPGLRGEALAATDSRVIVLKAGIGSGAGLGRKAKSFPFSHITSIEVSCGLIQGRLQVSAPGTAEAGQGSLKEAYHAENVVNFAKGSKKTSPGYKEFTEAAKALRQLVHEAQTGSSQSARGQDSSLADLEKLADLRDKGIITPEEFESKKKQILGV